MLRLAARALWCLLGWLADLVGGRLHRLMVRVILCEAFNADVEESGPCWKARALRTLYRLGDIANWCLKESPR